MKNPQYAEWSPDLAVKTEEILRRAEHRKSGWVLAVDFGLFYVLLFLAVLGNFFLSVVLVPFFLIAKGVELYVALFIIGLSFGAVFSFILHGIEKLERGHHIIAGIFIPAIALINVAIMAMLSNRLIDLMKLHTSLHNPFVIAVVYVGGYILPDILTRIRK